MLLHHSDPRLVVAKFVGVLIMAKRDCRHAVWGLDRQEGGRKECYSGES